MRRGSQGCTKVGVLSLCTGVENSLPAEGHLQQSQMVLLFGLGLNWSILQTKKLNVVGVAVVVIIHHHHCIQAFCAAMQNGSTILLTDTYSNNIYLDEIVNVMNTAHQARVKDHQIMC